MNLNSKSSLRHSCRMLKEIWTQKRSLEFTPTPAVCANHSCLLHNTYRSFSPSTCILLSHSAAQQQLKLSALRNTRFNNVKESSFHTAVVSVVTAELLCRAKYHSTQVLLKRNKTTVPHHSAENHLRAQKSISDGEKGARWGGFLQHRDSVNVENVV